MSAARRSGGGLRARLTGWWRSLPLMRAFACYTVCCIAVSGVVSLSVMAVCMELYDHLGERADGIVEVDAGPYVYDAGEDELVPAVSIDLPNDRLLFLGLRGGVGRASSDATGPEDGVAPGDGSARVEYATIGMLRADGGPELFDWGGNYTERDYIEAGGNPYDPVALPVDELAAYDARERADRAEPGGALALAADALAGSDGDIVVSNVGYYVAQPSLGAETGPMLALRVAAGFSPFAVLGLFSVLMFRRFYRRRLAEPLGTLHGVAGRIAAQDLDFEVGEVAGREFEGLARAFERMRASLAEAQRALLERAEERRRLNAAFAHDLRTPLTVLKGTLEMMGDGGAGDTEEVAVPVSSVAALAGQVARLESYAQAMSGITKLEDRVVERRETAFSSLAGDLAAAARAIASSAGRACRVRVRNECAGGASGGATALLSVDAALVEEVLGNLMGNACRYAEERVDLAVRLREGAPPAGRGDGAAAAASEEGALLLELTVVDDGPGFSAEALRHGCEAFFSERKSAEHFGLGLAISSILARVHGGDVALGNEAGGGARAIAVFAVGGAGGSGR